ncbi:MAG: amidohydrolase, partial [Betaproteobacteria bacterium]
LGPLPPDLASQELVRAAWEGLDPHKVWDAHAHLAGTGDSTSGIRIHPDMQSLAGLSEYARRLFFMNAACAVDGKPSVDAAYMGRMRSLVDAFPPGFKVLLFAFERVFNARGEIQWDSTALYVPDAYARDLARTHPQRFEWVASIHPYRRDCVVALEEAARDGARAVKWLPAAMGIDPASPQCDDFYAAAARLGMPLITHAGLERAVPGSDRQEWGNPLRLRRALDAGVRVVVAHCASMGEDRDLDAGLYGPYVSSFDLFARLMGEKRFEGRLFGDISAITQAVRARIALARILRSGEWHPRLLNGSDYPLPGLMPIFSVDALVAEGLLDAAAAPVLSRIRRHNAMLFDFVTKRLVAVEGKRLPASVFETRGFFARAGPPRGALNRTAQKIR